MASRARRSIGDDKHSAPGDNSTRGRILMNVLAVDVGGTNVKILATGHKEPRRFPSGPTLTADQMVAKVKDLAGEWKYIAVSVGYPGFVVRGRPIAEPHNLALGWV